MKICKDFKNGTCQKASNECSQAHPPPHCPIDNEHSLVTVCVDFIKGKCARETCKYFHPPEHLVNQLKKQKITNNAAAAAAAAALASNNLTIIPNIQGSPFGLHQLFSPNQLQFSTNLNNQYRVHQYPSSQYHYNSTNANSRQLGNNNNDTSYYSLPINYSALAAVNFVTANNKFNNATSNVASNLNLMPDLSTVNSNFQFAFQPTTSQHHFATQDPTNSTSYRNNHNSANNIVLRASTTAASFPGSAQQANNYNAQLSAALAATAGTNLV